MKKLRKWRNKIKDLENKSIDLENKQFDFNTHFESFQMNYQIQNRSVSGIKSRVDEIEENWEKNEANFAMLGDFMKNTFNGAPTNNSKGNSDVVSKSDFDKLVERINGNDSLIDGLISKVKKLSSNPGGSSKVQTPAFNKDTDKTLESRIKNLERMVSNLGNSGHANTKSNIALDFDIEERVKLLEKDIEDIKTTVPANTVGSNDGTTQSSMNYNLKKKLDALMKDNQEMKNAIMSYQQIMDGKADFDQLQEIDKVVTDKLNNCIKFVKRQMQDKTESTKNLKKLEKQLRNLYDILYNQGGVTDSDDDPLLGKKTMTPYSRSPYDKRANSKGHMMKYQMWK